MAGTIRKGNIFHRWIEWERFAKTSSIKHNTHRFIPKNEVELLIIIFPCFVNYTYTQVAYSKFIFEPFKNIILHIHSNFVCFSDRRDSYKLHLFWLWMSKEGYKLERKLDAVITSSLFVEYKWGAYTWVKSDCISKSLKGQSRKIQTKDMRGGVLWTKASPQSVTNGLWHHQ